MGDVVTFPLKGTKIEQWYLDAQSVKRHVNLASSQLWIRDNVPPQFQKMIDKNVRLIE